MIKLSKEKLEDNFDHYFTAEYHKRTEIFELLQLCCFYDPRFKDLNFLT